MSAPSDDDKEDFLLSCRYGDLDDIKKSVEQFGTDFINDLRDDNENCVLHMVCGNGHIDILDYLLPIVRPSLLSARNSAQSTPLHWATLNSHLPIVQKLVQFPGGPGINLIDIRNAAGRSPLAEAEMVGWDEGAKWLVQMMALDSEAAAVEEERDQHDEEATEGGPAPFTQDIEVEIEDADGQIAKMTISGER